MVMSNEHIPTEAIKQRVKDLAMAGIPKYMIAKLIKIDDETLTKYYAYELETGLAETIGDVARTVAFQAKNGNEKSQALLLKTQGARFGWVEKQVVETVSNDETLALKEKVKELEGKFDKDY